MFMALMALIIFASGPLLGGRLQLLADLRLRQGWLIAAALATQVVITEWSTGAKTVDIILHLATYAVAALALWCNRDLPGLLLIGGGTLLNGGVIALNGGTLPASRSALAQAGIPTRSAGFANSGVVHHAVLPWLGDIVATPAWLPFQNVFSIGDGLVLAGTFVLVHRVTRSRIGAALNRAQPHNSPVADEIAAA